MVSFLVLIIELWLFTGIILILHHFSPRIGLTPLFFYIASIITILNPGEILALFIEPFPGIILRTGGHVFVPLVLTALLILYIANGTPVAQLVLYGLTGINLFIITVLVFLLIYLGLSSETTPVTGFLVRNDVLNPRFLRGVIASTLTFFVNMFFIVIFYQGVKNIRLKIPSWITISFALIMALWVDSVLYNILANLGTPNFNLMLPGDVFAKTLSGLVISPMLVYYLTVVACKSPTFRGYEKRSTWDMLFGVFGGVSRSLKVLQQQMQEQEIALTLAHERVILLQDMVRDASHDLKTPISSLLLKIQLLERITDEKSRNRHLAELKNQSQQLATMVDDLFTLSRLDSNRVSDKQLINLIEMGQAAYQVFYPIAEQNKLQLEFVHGDTPIWYEGFADELERIFLNLLGNAIRYTSTGNVSMSVYEDERAVFIAIKDTGIGIHTDDIPHIFTRFFRGKTASQHGIRGTGLGLPIVKTIVELHNGIIDVKSTVGVGTVITVSLPKTPQLHKE
ncbi:MAG: HAMP domain-containing sensor histidine kinase [bacterium]|nr:HAMP domain-containing sensor histidine kinase [bacterium]